MLALVGSFPTHLRHYFPIGKPTKTKTSITTFRESVYSVFVDGSPLTLAKGIRGDPIGMVFVFLLIVVAVHRFNLGFKNASVAGQNIILIFFAVGDEFDFILKLAVIFIQFSLSEGRAACGNTGVF